MASAEVIHLGVLFPTEAPPAGQIVEQVVMRAPAATVNSLDLRLTYDPPTTPIVAVQAGSLAVASGMTLAANTSQPGVILVGLAGAYPAGGEGPMVVVTFGTSAHIPLTLAQALVNEGSLPVAIATNSVPSFVKGADQLAAQNAGPQTAGGWATAISSGAEDEFTQTVSFVVSNDRNYLFTVQPALSVNGTLTYTPAPNLRGTATATVRLRDNGGTGNGGQDTSTSQTLQITIGWPADSDGDGVPDDWVAAYGLGTHGPVNPNLDSDGDGLTDREEFSAGTNPTNTSDALRISAVAPVSGSEALSVQTVAGKVYRVERNDDFPTGPWVQVGNDVTGTGEALQILDAEAASLRKGVYRVRVVQ